MHGQKVSRWFRPDSRTHSGYFSYLDFDYFLVQVRKLVIMSYACYDCVLLWLVLDSLVTTQRPCCVHGNECMHSPKAAVLPIFVTGAFQGWHLTSILFILVPVLVIWKTLMKVSFTVILRLLCWDRYVHRRTDKKDCSGGDRQITHILILKTSQYVY